MRTPDHLRIQKVWPLLVYHQDDLFTVLIRVKGVNWLKNYFHLHTSKGHSGYMWNYDIYW